jgi:hypothetical protein
MKPCRVSIELSLLLLIIAGVWINSPSWIMRLYFQVSLRRLAIAIAAALASLALAHAMPTSSPVASGAITIYPIPQRPPYAPNPWLYPRPTTVQPLGH